MRIPENGRVVVIDDKVEEGLPLTIALSKNKIPTIYYSGKLEELPSKPLVGIRIVFLDIVLGTDGQPRKTQLATAVNIFKRIINKNNGPYLLIAWTKHPEYISAIKTELADIPPILLLDMEKSNCRDTNGNFDIKKIERKIKTALRNLKAFHLFVLWESLLHKAAGDIVNDFSSFYSNDSEWDNNTSSIFFHLARAYLGEKADFLKDKEIIKNALLTMNSAFIDTIENEIRNYRFSFENINKNDIANDVRARINKKLLLYFERNLVSAEPGNVYKSSRKLGGHLNVGELFSDNKLDTYLQKADLISKAKFIFLEVSPPCDYAQNNLRIHRCLWGVMWPIEHAKKIKKGDFIYTTPLLEIDGKFYKLVFNMRYLMSMPIRDLQNKKALFRIRHDMLTDIQSHMARHVNRPGIVSVNEKKT